jgi:hypothetical protein
MAQISSLPRRIYLVNVGVNASHRLKSPIYPDGHFEFVPIPEEEAAQDSGSGDVQPVRYRDLHCYHSSESLLSLFPEQVRAIHTDRVVHDDPHLGHDSVGRPDDFSYGDIPLVNPRASALRQARVGDWLVFIANLADYDVDRHGFTGKRALYLIGLIEIGRILEYRPSDRTLWDRDTPHPYPLTAYAGNAHVNRVRRLPDHYRDQPFSIFGGSTRSTRFQHAVELTQERCRVCFTDKQGQPFDDRGFPTFMACVGAYTRSVRAQFSLEKEADRRRFRTFCEQIAEQTNVADLLA